MLHLRHRACRPPVAGLLLALLSAACGAPPQPLAGEGIRPGLYRQRAALCSPAPAAGAAACSAAQPDCLLVQLAPGPGGQARVELFSTQAHQHVCVVNALARPDGRDWRVDDTDTPGQGLRIERQRDALRLSHLAPARPGLHPFCGAMASLQGYSFALSSWQAPGGACVPDAFK